MSSISFESTVKYVIEWIISVLSLSASNYFLIIPKCTVTLWYKILTDSIEVSLRVTQYRGGSRICKKGGRDPKRGGAGG